jgi:sugar lactone lactonase YvrE/acetyl esterase/lipase
MLRSLRCAAGVLVFCSALPAGRLLAEEMPATVAAGAKLVSVYSDDRFFEGPAWDPVTKKLYFTAFADGEGKKNEQILRLDGPGKVAVWLDKTEGVNGMYLANDGRLLGAQAFGHRLLSFGIGPDGPTETRVLLDDRKLHQPNDVAQSPTGDIYFTDPDFKNAATSAVYLLTPAGEVKKIIEDMQVTNGLKVSNNGKTLYVADDGPKNWRSYPIQPDGTVGPGEVFFDPPVSKEKRTDPDGMSIDEKGNLYLSGSGGVWVVDRFGQSLGLIPIPEFCSNVTFGGDDGKTLYLTCSKQVYSLAMAVRGGQFVRKNKEVAIAGATPPRPADGIEFREDVEFGTGGETKLTLHLARPATAKGPLPGLVFIHGGGWAAGNKNDLKEGIRDAARRGYVAISVGYRFAPKNPFPAQVEDVKCAVRWMRAHAGELQLDPSQIGAIGFSAGAHLSMMLGVMDKDDGLEGTGGWADQSSKVQAVVAYFGPVDLLGEYPPASQNIVKNFIGGTKAEKTAEYKRASPVTYVNAGDAPMLLFQGTEDVLVPYDQAFTMTKALSAAKVPGRIELMLGANHGWGGKELSRTLQTGYDFFAEHLKK